MELVYKLTRNGTILDQGSGRTVDFSGTGLLFQPDRKLPSGVELELLIDWPVQIDGATVLHAAISGRVIRTSVEGTAVTIRRFRFLPGPANLKR
ncbi:MAG TPA: hypothetical protein VGF16_01980 [Bryobacteraceae bacterium]